MMGFAAGALLLLGLAWLLPHRAPETPTELTQKRLTFTSAENRRLINGDSDDEPTTWTADSKTVLFHSYRNGKWEILKQGVNRDAAGPLVAGPQSAYLPRLSPDGAWVIYGSLPPGNLRSSAPIQLMRIPVNGGVPQLVLHTQYWLDWQCSRAPSGLCVILEATQDGKRVLLTAFDPHEGQR